LLTDNNEQSNGKENDLDYSKKLYKETSKRLDKAYIILISFILFFFFALYLPYTFLEHKIESSFNDQIIVNLSQLSRLALAQENISKSIQNEIDKRILPAIDDYKRLDEYFRKLELLESKAILTSSNLSANELESIYPTFLICNQQFHSNITHWVSCNAKIVANGINNKTILTLHELRDQLSPLVKKSRNNLQDVKNIAAALSKLNKTASQLPAGIERRQWEDIQVRVLNVTDQTTQLKYQAESVDNFLKRSNDSVLWTTLNIPVGSELAYNENIQREFDERITLLNQTKNQLRQALKDISTKFEEMEFPVIGKIPVGLANAVIAFPSAIGIGSLICSYYLGQTISKRLVFHRIFNKLDPNRSFNGELYPVWVDPLDRKLFQYSRLALFVSLPLVILFLITDLSLAGPTNPGDVVGFTFLDVPEDTVLAVGISVGLVLIALGIFIILKESHEYSSFLKKIKNC